MIVRAIFSLIAFLGLVHVELAQQKPWPKFEDYAVKEKFSGTPAKPKLTSVRARMFRTKIREQTAHGSNFAGHYRIAIWGCGTWCVQFAIIDCETGEVYFPPKVETVGGILPMGPMGEDTKLLEYRVRSRLLVVAGAVDDSLNRRTEGKFFYEWKDNHLGLIRKMKLKL